jgi:membrane protein implicated in regulation of membrane protease activity
MGVAMDASPETWRWVWLVASLVLIGGELAVPGTFILLPFGISAAVAAVLSFLDVNTAITWVVFLGLGIGLFVVFWRAARRVTETQRAPVGVGAERQVGAVGEVIVGIPPSPTGSGEVRILGELWRAESDNGEAIPAGAVVEVVGVRGTRLLVKMTRTPSPVPDEEI